MYVELFDDVRKLISDSKQKLQEEVKVEVSKILIETFQEYFNKHPETYEVIWRQSSNNYDDTEYYFNIDIYHQTKYNDDRHYSSELEKLETYFMQDENILKMAFGDATLKITKNTFEIIEHV